MKKLMILFFSVLITLSMFSTVNRAYALEEAGGQVETKGKIVFYEENSSNDSSWPQTGSQSKPQGKIPQLGDLNNKYVWIGLSFLLFSFFLVFVKNTRRRHIQ